jgi:hypothetical protein
MFLRGTFLGAWERQENMPRNLDFIDMFRKCVDGNDMFMSRNKDGNGLLLVGESRGCWLPGPGAGFAAIMDIVRIILRVLANFARDIPFTRRRLRATMFLRRRASSWRSREVERLDRIRNPSKYRPV